MTLYEVGRVCMKIAGRDARKKCVIVDVLESPYVLIDGETRRRKCNTAHLEPLNVLIDLSANADNAAVVAALKEQGIVSQEKKDAKKIEKPRPKKQKVKKKKALKKAAKKAEKKE